MAEPGFIQEINCQNLLARFRPLSETMPFATCPKLHNIVMSLNICESGESLVKACTMPEGALSIPLSPLH